MDRERLFYLAFNFDPATGQPVIYRPFTDDSEEDCIFEQVYDHFYHCMEKYGFIEAIPPFEISKKIFGDMYYDLKDGE